MKCPYCGKEVSNENKFCDGCGAKLENKPAADPNAFNYQQPKKNNTGLIVTIIIISVLVIAGIIIGIVLLTSGGKNSDNKKNYEVNGTTNKNEEPKENFNTKNLADNIEYKETKLADGSFVVFVENKNKVDADVTLKLEFLDSDGVVVDDEVEYLNAVAPGQQSYVKFYYPTREYAKYKISLEAEKSYFYKSQYDNVKISSKDDKENEEINITFTNNSKEEVDCRVSVLFYKNNTIVGYEYDYESEIDAGKSVALYVEYPYVGYNETFEFDDYKVYISEAYSSKY